VKTDINNSELCFNNSELEVKMKDLKPISYCQNTKKILLKPVQFIALLSMGIELGVSYSHLMQLPGKSQLSLPTFVVVQNILIKYKIGLGIVETGSFLSLFVILWLCRHRKSLIFLFTLVSLLMLVTAYLVWGIFIEPINTAINTWTAVSYPTNWTVYRDRWHVFHLARLLLLTIGMSSLISSVLIKKT
jgi:hypothetical protein